MVFSTSSLVSVAFMSSLGIMALWLYLRDINGIVQIGIKGTFIIIALILIRIIFPFEFSFARTIPSDYIMVFIRDTLKNEISLFTITLIVKEFLLATWLLGIVIHGFMAIKARIDFRHFIDRLPRKDNDKVNQILSSIMSKRHKTTPFEIICSSEISIPMLYGIINPKIIIPDIDLSTNEWEFILEHEIGHYYNYDLQTILFIQFLNVIYWWNPLIYLLNAEVDNLLEIRADAFVTKDLDEAHKIEYLSCLLSVLKKLPKNNRKHDVIALTGAKKSVLSHRYQFILARNESPIKRVKPSLKTIFLIGLENDNYEENLAFTEKINNLMNKKYPGLSKGIYKKGGVGVNGVYNQDFSNRTILIEIGGYENTPSEVLNSTLAFAECFLEVIKTDEG